MRRTKALHDKARTQADRLAEWNQTLEQRVAEQLAEIKHLDWLKCFLARCSASITPHWAR
jgi:adenylate cyclase